MNFIRFEAYSGKAKSEGAPEIGILKSGSFGFTSGFIRKFKLGKPGYVALRFSQDEENFYVGFSFNATKKTDYFKIYYPKSDYGITAALSFFKAYKIDQTKYKRRYQAEEYDDEIFGRMYVIKIRKQLPSENDLLNY